MAQPKVYIASDILKIQMEDTRMHRAIVGHCQAFILNQIRRKNMNIVYRFQQFYIEEYWKINTNEQYILNKREEEHVMNKLKVIFHK